MEERKQVLLNMRQYRVAPVLCSLFTLLTVHHDYHGHLDDRHPNPVGSFVLIRSFWYAHRLLVSPLVLGSCFVV